MAITSPTAWQILGHSTDLTGAAQIARGRVIGGAATADGQDEASILVENATYGWTLGCRAVLGELTIFGETAGQQPIFTTTTAAAAAYDQIAELIVPLGEGRDEVQVYVDYIGCDLEFTALDNTLSILDTATTTSATRTQTTVTLDYGSDYDGRLRIGIKQHVDPTAGQLFAVRILEAASSTSDNVTAGFVGQDALLSGARTSLSGFTLQGIDGNVEAVNAYRLRRYSNFWVDNETTGGTSQTQPIIACDRTIGIPVSEHRVSPGCDQIKMQIYNTVADATMNYGFGYLDLEGDGGWHGSTDVDTTQATSASNVAVELTVDVTGMAGKVLLLVVLMRSERGSAVTGSPVSMTGVAPITSRSRFELDKGGAHGMTLSTSERYVIDGLVKGASSPTDHILPGARTVVFNNDPDFYVWPLYDDDDLNSTFGAVPWELSVTKLSRATFKSITVIEEQNTARPALRNSLLTGLPVSSSTIQRLYARERQFFKETTRVLHGTGGYDPDHQTNSQIVNLWGAMQNFDDAGSDSGWYEMGATMAGPYATFKDEGGSTATRTEIVVRGVLQVACRKVWNDPTTANCLMRLKLAGWGSAWDQNVVTSDEVTVPCEVLVGWRDEGAPASADLAMYQHTGTRMSYHYLRGCVSYGDLLNRRHGFVPFEIPITDTQTSATDRLLKIQFKQGGGVAYTDSQGVTAAIYPHAIVVSLVAWTAYIREVID